MLIIFIVTLLVSWIVSSSLKRKFRKYSQIPLSTGLSGKEIAEDMLRDHGIFDVEVISTPGRLTDHYNPGDKTINLSDDVYHGRSAAAAAVAAHETGHAIQHATSYSMLEFRSMLAPAQYYSGWLINLIMILGFVGVIGSFFPIEFVLLAIIGAYGVITLFSFITLPVEFDASKRAMQWITRQGIVNAQEEKMAKDALNTAALTYVVAALSSLAYLVYYVWLFVGADD